MPHGPYGDEVGLGISLLETFLLIALGRLVNAGRMLEFGTHRGCTARALAYNIPAAWIDTVDLATCIFPGFPRIKPFTVDSRTFVPPQKYDLIFVDGGHEQEIFENDTSVAFRAINPGGVIIWHDVGNPDFPHIEPTLSRNSKIVKVSSTQLAILWDGLTK